MSLISNGVGEAMRYSFLVWNGFNSKLAYLYHNAKPIKNHRLSCGFGINDKRPHGVPCHMPSRLVARDLYLL
jgi:hypothetical protein